MKQNKLSRLQVAYTCNDRMYNALYLSILSIVKRTKHPVDFYLFSANLKEKKFNYISLTKKHEASIRRMIERHSKSSTFTVMDCRKYYLERCNGKTPYTSHWPPYATFRLLFDRFEQLKGLVLYMDTDTMACGDISKAFEIPMKNYEMCVTEEIYAWEQSLLGRYFNSGVLLMNMDKIRQTKYLEKAFNCMIEKKLRFCDQDALNFAGKYIRYWPDDRFNRIWRKRLDSTIIKHFAGPVPKPWRLNFKRFYQSLNYEIWKEDIAEWRRMRRK